MDTAPSGAGSPTRSSLRALLDRPIIRFGIVGVFNSAFVYGVFAGLQVTIGESVHYLVLLGISHVIGVLEAYLLARWLVFQVQGRWWQGLLRFWSVYLVALGINVVALPLLVELVHLPVLPAQALITATTALGSFFAHRSFTFRRSGEPEPTPDTR
jgi:putative flippase GtrA